MGGPTSSTDINKSFGQAFNKTQNELQNQSQNQTGATSAALTPWAGVDIAGLLRQLTGTPAAPSPAETGALNQITSFGSQGNPYAPQIGGVASTLLAGGGPDRTGLPQQAYDQYAGALQPTIAGDYLDPSRNPFFAKTTETIGNDVQNRLAGLYAGGGRDPAGAGDFGRQLARGISEGTAPIFSSIYENERGRQLGAAGSRFGAAGSTTGLLSGLDQNRLGNMQAGIGAAGAANEAQMWGPQAILQAEAQRRGIPMQILAQQLGMAFPAAQAFGTQAGTTAGSNAGTVSGYSSGYGGVTGQGTEQQTKSMPFSPWSLAPLAFLPFGGGGNNSLAGGLFDKAFGGGGFLGLNSQPVSTESGAGYSSPIGPTMPWWNR